MVACLHSTITAVMGLAEMNGAEAGRHILPFMTEIGFVHKTNGENQWKLMAQSNGRKERDLIRIYDRGILCKVKRKAGNTGLLTDL